MALTVAHDPLIPLNPFFTLLSCSRRYRRLLNKKGTFLAEVLSPLSSCVKFALVIYRHYSIIILFYERAADHWNTLPTKYKKL